MSGISSVSLSSEIANTSLTISDVEPVIKIATGNVPDDRTGQPKADQSSSVAPNSTQDSFEQSEKNVSDYTKLIKSGKSTPNTSTDAKTNHSKESGDMKSSDNATKSPVGKELSDSERKQVEKLKSDDTKVQQHEAAHAAAGGDLVRGKSFSYTVGPDGKRYAIGGEVQIDISPVADDPAQTIQKMERIRRAALAPSDPSAQDRSVATTAQSIESQAQGELNEHK